VLIADDPDGTWTHWLLWNLPVSLASLQEGLPAREKFENGAAQGQNDFSRTGYDGPCPPPGKPHRDFFKLYELDAALALRLVRAEKNLSAL
jgi:Raf kinase inhibitor-like YbhB/YbcL family protein